MPNLIGQSIGRYHILEQLGEGGMAIVYKAYDTRLERDVAVKVIRTERLTIETTPKALKRFEHEAKALGKLTHPNIIPVSDYGEYESKPYLVMPYLPSGTLKQKMEKPIPWQEAIQILLPIAEALDYAHSQNMIHRDVKPSNILLTQRGQPMLTDFGIAKILDLEETQDLTGTNAAVGTPEYMAPEQATSKAVDHRADIYSLGVVLYEMVTGRKPYIADTPMAVLIKLATEPLPSPKQYAPNLPDAVEKVLLKALAKNPKDRYQDMREFVVALERLAGSVSIIGLRATPVAGALQKRTWLLWVGGAVFLLAGLILGLIFATKRLVPSVVSTTSTPSATSLPTLVSPTVTALTPTQATGSPHAACAPNCTYNDMTVGFIQGNEDSWWRTANTDSFKETATQLGLTLKYYDAPNTHENQLSAFRKSIVDKDVNVIVLAALELTGWDEVLQEAKTAGKVVVLEDRLIDAPDNLYATYVGLDFVEEGRKAAVAMCKLLEGSAKKNVVELVGSLDHPAATGRGQGFREKMGDCGISITQSQNGNWASIDGKAAMTTFLEQSRDIQGVFAQNDDMGFGAIEAIKASGIKPGKDIKIVSVDGTYQAFNAMIAGDLNVTVECTPLMAPQAYEAALKALNGEFLQKFIPVNDGVYFAEDAATVLPTRKYK